MLIQLIYYYYTASSQLNSLSQANTLSHNFKTIIHIRRVKHKPAFITINLQSRES